MTTRISIIVPVYNNAKDLAECVAALKVSADEQTEIIVVDDASTDDTVAAAKTMGVVVLEMAKNSGPGAARNYGATRAQGDVVMFVDADVVVAPDVVARVRRAFDADPQLAAVFGSYDAMPRARGIVTQYRNLLHHFTHQSGNPEASTFWAGCGAVRRAVFAAVGGFDQERFARPSIEDIELGMRMRRAGYRILLDKHLQGKHLKQWSLRSMVVTDIKCRAIPWSRLILETGGPLNDLNLKHAQRLSGVLVMLLSLTLPLVLVWPKLGAAAGALVLAVLLINRDLFGFLARQRGVLFALACLPLHLLYFLYSTLSYLVVWISMHAKTPVATDRALSRETR